MLLRIVQVQAILRPTVSRPVHLGVGPTIRFLLLSGIWGLHVVRRPPWREDDCVIYSYNTLLLSGKSHRIHDHILLCHLRLLGSLFVSSCDSQGYSGGILTRLPTNTCLSSNWLHGVISQMLNRCGLIQAVVSTFVWRNWWNSRGTAIRLTKF
jgi:hypothetical protein